jgi:hypothetical protein
MNFFMRAFYSQNEDVSAELDKKTHIITSGIFPSYFKNIDFSKFKSGIDPQDILQMLTWMTDGYIHEQQRISIPSIEDLMQKFRIWTTILKKASYKED